MIKFPCPKCQAKLKCDSAAAGKKIKCPKCSTSVPVPLEEIEVIDEVVPVDDDEPKKSSKVQTTRKTKSITVPPPDDDEPKKKPAAKKKHDEDDEDEAPRKKFGKAKRRQGSSQTLMWVGGGAAALIAVIVAGVAVFLLSGDKKKSDSKPLTNANATAATNFAATPATAAVTNTPPVETPKADTERKAPARQAGASRNDIYRHVLKSTAWVVNLMSDGRAATGTGTIVDRKNRLMLTNYHVVYRQQHLLVLFPIYEGEKLIAEKETYMKKAKERALDAIPGRVLAEDQKRDLALVQLDKLPENVLSLALSDKRASTGDDILSLGNPGGSESLWLLTTGTVRQVSHKKWKSVIDEAAPLQELEADVVETQSPTNHGDSGGPMVNMAGEMVGVTQGIFDPGQTQLMSIFIDVSEARDFIDKTCKNRGLAWEKSDRKLATFAMGDVAELVKDLESLDAKTRAQAAQGLAEMGPNARLAVPGLLKLLRDPDDLCRSMAHTALERIGAPDKITLPLLKEALKDVLPAVRAYAAEALGKIGAEASTAGPNLIEVLKDGETSVRRHAARSLSKIGFDDRDKLTAVLTPLLDDGDKGVRLAAAESLTAGSTDVAGISKLLKHRDMEVRVCACSGLGKLGQQAKKAIPALMEAFPNSPGKEARRAIIEVLAIFGADAKAALSLFIDAMQDKELRSMAALALSKMGADAKAAVRVLTEALADSTDDTKRSCLIALGKIGPDAREAVPALKPILRDRKSSLRMDALATVEEIGPGAVDLVADLIELLGESAQVVKDGRIFTVYNKDLHGKLTDVLGKIGKGAITPLHQSLNNKEKLVRLGCVVALGKIGPDAKGTAQALNFLLQTDADPDVQSAAIVAFQKVTAPKKPTPPVKPKTTTK